VKPGAALTGSPNVLTGGRSVGPAGDSAGCVCGAASTIQSGLNARRSSATMPNRALVRQGVQNHRVMMSPRLSPLTKTRQLATSLGVIRENHLARSRRRNLSAKARLSANAAVESSAWRSTLRI
jgi:hypothetical protein